jgi:hypothetical protein
MLLNQKNPVVETTGFLIKIGDDILSRNKPVPSALMSLTSLFGMGRGGPHRNSHLKLEGW